MLILIETSDDPKYCFYNGKMCRWVKLSNFGLSFNCVIFNSKVTSDFVRLERDYDNGDKLLRCDQCLELEQSNKA